MQKEASMNKECMQCSERKNHDYGAEGAMFKIFSLLPYAAAVVLAVVVFAWGQT